MCEDQGDALLAGIGCGIEQLGINVFAVGRLIVKPPEIKTAYAVGLERPGELDAALQNFILLIKGEVGVELIALGTELRLRRAGPVNLEKRAGYVSYAQAIFFLNSARFFHFFIVKLEHVLV